MIELKIIQKNRHRVEVYFEIGKILSKAGKEYGKNIIKQYSEKLVAEVGTKYNDVNKSDESFIQKSNYTNDIFDLNNQIINNDYYNN